MLQAPHQPVLDPTSLLRPTLLLLLRVVASMASAGEVPDAAMVGAAPPSSPARTLSPEPIGPRGGTASSSLLVVAVGVLAVVAVVERAGVVVVGVDVQVPALRPSGFA